MDLRRMVLMMSTSTVNTKPMSDTRRRERRKDTPDH